MSDINFNQVDVNKVLFDEAWHREQHRREFDIIRIFSPRQATVKGVLYELPSQDLYIMYDINQYQKVPFGATMDVPRPRAMWFVKHRKDEILNFVNQKMHDEFIENRRKKGFPDYADKSVENKETYESAAYPKTNDPQVVAELYNQLWLGLVIKAASDTPPAQDPRSGEVNLKPVDTQAFDDLQNKVVEPSSMAVMNEPKYVAQADYTPREMPVEPPQTSPFAAMNEKLDVNDVTK